MSDPRPPEHAEAIPLRSPVRRWALVLLIAVGATFFAAVVAARVVDEAARRQIPPDAPTLITDLRRTGRPVQALYLIESGALSEGWTAERLRLAGDVWREIGDGYAAAAYWERAARQLPDDLLLARDLAEMYLSLGEYVRGADALVRLRTLVPDDRWAAFHLGMIRAAVDPAAADLLLIAAQEPAYAPATLPVIEALRLNADDGTSRTLAVGIAMVETGQWAYAELAFSSLVGDPAYAALALAYSGWARDMQGKDGGADIRRAVSLAPEDARVRVLQGLHLRRIGDEEASLIAFETAVALDPAQPAAYAELGAAYALLGDRSSAQYWLETAVALSNNDPRYQAILNQFLSEERDLLTMMGILPEIFPEATAESTLEPAAAITPELTSAP